MPKVRSAKGKKIRIILSVTAALALAATLTLPGIDNRLVVRNYTVPTEKVGEEITLAFVSDLHTTSFGKNQSELVAAIDAQKPDAVIFGGDMFERVSQAEKSDTKAFMTVLAEKYPCAYVTGNHEFYSEEVDKIKSEVREAGVTVLDGAGITLDVREQRINIYGCDDFYAGFEKMTEQATSAFEKLDPDAFTVFVSHRPRYVEDYCRFESDLILCGHTHGGLVRIPGILNGLISPEMQLFSDYLGGEYKLGERTLIVGRGLTREFKHLPRFYNPPELVIIKIAPDGENINK